MVDCVFLFIKQSILWLLLKISNNIIFLPHGPSSSGKLCEVIRSIPTDIKWFVPTFARADKSVQRLTLVFIFLTWIIYFFLGWSQMSRIRVNFLHHWTANKRNVFQAENRLPAKSPDGFANACPRSYFQVTLYVIIVQQVVIPEIKVDIFLSWT